MSYDNRFLLLYVIFFVTTLPVYSVFSAITCLFTHLLVYRFVFVVIARYRCSELKIVQHVSVPNYCCTQFPSYPVIFVLSCRHTQWSLYQAIVLLFCSLYLFFVISSCQCTKVLFRINDIIRGFRRTRGLHTMVLSVLYCRCSLVRLCPIIVNAIHICRSTYP